MKKLLIIALVAVAMVLMAFHIIVYDATSGSPRTCEVHGLTMSKRTVALRWGMKPQSDTDTARSHYFPHPRTVRERLVPGTAAVACQSFRLSAVHDCARCLATNKNTNITMTPNPAGSVDAPIATLFALVALGRRATDQQRWA